MSDEGHAEHDRLIESVDVKREKIDRKFSVVEAKLREAHTALGEVQRIEFLVSQPKEARGL